MLNNDIPIFAHVAIDEKGMSRILLLDSITREVRKIDISHLKECFGWKYTHSVRYIHDIGHHIKNAQVDEQFTYDSSDLWALTSTSSYEQCGALFERLTHCALTQIDKNSAVKSFIFKEGVNQLWSFSKMFLYL